MSWLSICSSWGRRRMPLSRLCFYFEVIFKPLRLVSCDNILRKKKGSHFHTCRYCSSTFQLDAIFYCSFFEVIFALIFCICKSFVTISWTILCGMPHFHTTKQTLIWWSVFKNSPLHALYCRHQSLLKATLSAISFRPSKKALCYRNTPFIVKEFSLDHFESCRCDLFKFNAKLHRRPLY